MSGNTRSPNLKSIQTYKETSLHAALKNWYTQPGDLIESRVDGYRIDIVRGALLIEIQISNFSRLRAKIKNLLVNHQIRLVYPIPMVKWIKYIDTDKRRLSPRKGKLEHIYQELVYIIPFLSHPNLSLEVLFIHEEEIRLRDGRGSWRRKGTSIIDRRLVSVDSRLLLDIPTISRNLLTEFKNREFTSKDIALHRKITANLARKLAYYMLKTEMITITGKRGRHNLFAFRCAQD